MYKPLLSLYKICQPNWNNYSFDLIDGIGINIAVGVLSAKTSKQSSLGPQSPRVFELSPDFSHSVKLRWRPSHHFVCESFSSWFHLIFPRVI